MSEAAAKLITLSVAVKVNSEQYPASPRGSWRTVDISNCPMIALHFYKHPGWCRGRFVCGTLILCNIAAFLALLSCRTLKDI